MNRKYAIRKPTHLLVHDDHVYAEIRCGHWSPAVKLISTGETQRMERGTASTMDCDLLMGHWQAAIYYLFGRDAVHIPDDAKMILAEDYA